MLYTIVNAAGAGVGTLAYAAGAVLGTIVNAAGACLSTLAYAAGAVLGSNVNYFFIVSRNIMVKRDGKT